MAAWLLLLVAPSMGCLSDSDRRDAAINEAIAHLDGRIEKLPPGSPIHPYVLMFLDIAYRRFGVEEFSNTRHHYDQTLEFFVENPSETFPPATIRIFRRVLVAENQIQPGDLESVHDPLNFMTGHALYCDQVPLPEDYSPMLQEAFKIGGYPLTHAALAMMMARDLGCEPLASPELTAQIIAGMEAIPNTDGNVTDLEIEAAVFLCYLGHRDKVSDEFLRAVVEAQRPDGGWSWESAKPKKGPDYHATGMALWLLLEVQRGDQAADTLVAQPNDTS